MNDLFQVIHEDSDLLVVNKPAGLVCHPTKTDERSSLIGRVRLHLGHAEGRLVNRLDRETSGLVLVAKSASVAGELGKLIESSVVEKEYAAIVQGCCAYKTLSPMRQSFAQEGPGPDEFTIDAPLGKDESSAVAIRDCVRPDGAAARTQVRVEKCFTRAGGGFSLLRIQPLNGRKHQIRIHLAHVGHPLVGDKIYGADEQIYLRLVRGELTDGDRARLLLANHALHAGRLKFGWRGREWEFRAEPEREFRDFAGP